MLYEKPCTKCQRNWTVIKLLVRKLPVLTFFAISRLSDIQSEKFFQILYWGFLTIIKHILEFIQRNVRYPWFVTFWRPLWPWETKCSTFAAVYLPRIYCRHIIQQLCAMKFVVQDNTRLTSKSGFCSWTIKKPWSSKLRRAIPVVSGCYRQRLLRQRCW